MDVAEINDKLDKLGRDWKEFRERNDKMIEQKADGKGVAELKESIEKIGKSIDIVETLKKDVENFKAAQSRMQAQKKDKNGELLPEDHDEVKKSWNAFMRKGGDGVGGGGAGLMAWQGKTTSMSVISDADGGFLVTADQSGRIVEKVYETSDVRQVASVQPISSDALEGMYDTDEAGAEWVSELGTRNQTNTPQLGQWRIPVHELSAKPQASQKLLDDAKIDVEAWLARKVASKFSRTENTAFVSGNGVGKPRGFLDYARSTSASSNATGTVLKVKSGSNGALDPDKLLTVIYSLKAPYRARAKWAMNRTLIGKVRQLKDSYGQYLWQPGLQMGTPSQLLGYGIAEFNDMPDASTGSASIAFGDWAEFYQIVDRLGLRVLRDPFTANPYVKFITTKRVGGAVTNFEAGIVHTLET